MAHPRVRPEFARPLTGSAEEFFAALARALATDPGRCRGRSFEHGAILRIRSDQRRFWSPALHLHVENDETGGVSVRGRFSPSSPIWTAFLAIYLALTCIGLAAASYGSAQWTVGERPWAFLGVPIALALAGFTYGAAFIGQGLGAEDMFELRSFVERVVDGTGDTPLDPRAGSAIG